MSPTQEYQAGRWARAVACWGEQLAAGRSWREIEAEIIDCCRGRVDLLTRLLIEAEMMRDAVRPVTGGPRVPGPSGAPRLALATP